MQRKYRLKGERTFKVIYKRGESVGSKQLSLIYLKNRMKDSIKVGFSVSKKVGNSVKRNLVRRRLKEIFRELIPCIEKGYNYIIVVKSDAAIMSFQELKTALTALLQRAKKLSNNL